MIHYIIGRAGYGKTRMIYQQIKDMVRTQPYRKCILLVPELFTLQAERDLIEYLGDGGLLQAEVLSFSSLARRILEDTGRDKLVLLSSLGKTLLLKKILLEQNHQLKLYGQAGKRNGVLEQLADTLEELKREGVAPQDLRNLAENPNSRLFQQKLQDLALLQEQLDQYMEGHYLDAEARQQIVLKSIPKCSFLHDSMVWVDGFSGFTTPNLQLMEQLFYVVRDVTISFTMDLRLNIADAELFEPVRVSWEKVRQRAENAHFREGAPIFLHEPYPKRKPAPLRHLEHEGFTFPIRSYQGKIDVLQIHETESVYAEVTAAARQILLWSAEKNLRWKEIGLVVFDLETYAPLIERVFQEYGIPGFISGKYSIMHQPLVQFLLATLNSARKNLRFEDVFASFKTNLSIFPPEVYEELENYCLAWGIEGRRWENEFTAGSPERLEQLNQWREEFWDYVQQCFPALRTAETYGDFTRALYQCIETLHIREKLLEQISILHQQERMDAASKLEQTWKYIMEMMDQFVEILGSQPVQALQYEQVLQAGLASVEISILPDSQDQVVIGDMQQALMPEVKALWVLGFHDGVLPAVNMQKGVLLAAEREFFRENGQELDLSPDLKVMQEYYHVYQNLARSQQMICFSYALSNEEGRAQKPSIFIEQLGRMFPGIMRTGITETPRIPAGSRAVFPLFLEKMCGWRDGMEPEEPWPQVYQWYRENPVWKPRVEKMEEALFYTNYPQKIEKRQAGLLYRRNKEKDISISISRMERYARCPFSHFIHYGLRPEERKEFSLKAFDIGDYMHLLLERYGHRVDCQHLDWKKIQQQECEAILQEILQEMPEDYGGGVFESSYGNRYLQKRLNRMFSLSAWMITRQIGRGEYHPCHYELEFGRYGEIPPVEIPLPDGQKILLEGRIDRVDLYQKDDSVWLRIIDYKTGVKNFQLSDLYYGVGIQLALYAAAMLRGWAEKDSRAAHLAGIFFFHLSEPWLGINGEAVQEKLNHEILKEFRLNGLMMKDIEIIQSMDRDLQAGNSSEIIPAGLLKNNTLSARTSALEEKDLQIVLDYAAFWLQESVQKMMEGECSIYPSTDGKGNTACSYCPYHSICQFDVLFKENQYRWLYKLDDKKVIEKIKSVLQNAGRKGNF